MQVEETIRSKPFDDSIRFTLIQQVPIAIGCFLLLDFGVTAKVCAVAMIAFWSGVVLLVTRRRDHLSTTDLGFIRWGFLPIFLASKLLGSIWISWYQS